MRSPAAGQSSNSAGATPPPPPRSSGTPSGRRRAEDAVRIVGEYYQLGAEIGRGGFGTVFAALDLRNGRSVAIKQISLHDIDREELQAIESEISLLRKLNHENIVKYHDTIKTQQCLYIVLEYMENGSLAQFLKKFGSLSETLVAMYVTQVLRGLAYLHEQGVLHRDIKGANILTTKDGLVKLADFGVAVKLSDTQKSNSVVGSPYWMAPEVIEMAGWSFASDIWSVGCTIIELLSTKPPYFDLAPMAALFRIVQDDHPPLPERISPALHDFIMKCFMKEPRLRGSAEELLAHPWIAQIPKNKVEQSSQLVAESVTSSNDRDAMLNTIKLYEKDQHTEPFSSPEVMEDAEDEENWDDEFGIDSAPAPISLSNGAVRRESQEIPVVHTLAELQSEPSQSAFHLSKEDAKAIFNDEVWDDSDEDEEGMLLLRLQQQQPPLSNESFGSRSVFVKAPPPSATSSWDRSTLVPMEKRMTKLQYFSEQDDDDGFGDIDEEQLLQAVQQTQLSADKDDDFNDLDDSKFHQRSSYFGFDGTDMARENIFDDELDFEYSSVRDPHQKATTRVVELLALLDPSMDDNVILDACNQLQDIFESNLPLRRDLMSRPGIAPNIMEALEVKQMDVLYAVLKVVNLIIEDNQRFQENLALVGLIPVIIKLTKQYQVNTFTLQDVAPENKFSHLVRLEAAKFVRQTCKTSSLTLQMYIACGGLPVLVDFLTVESDNSKELMRIALGGIFSVFHLQTIPKNDICRLFVKAGLLHKFVMVFNDIVHCVRMKTDFQSPSDNWTRHELHKMCDILLLFSQGDVIVKEHMCDRRVLRGLLNALELCTSPTEDPAADAHFGSAMLTVLKCIRNLSMEPLTLERLDRAGSIPTLVHLLNVQDTDNDTAPSPLKQKEVENIALQSMYYLCRINRNRQTHAAQSGVIPSLMKVIKSASPLKQFALPILCDLAHASPIARSHLWTCDGITLFLELLEDKYWQVDAIKSISVWLVHDTNRMENVLLLPNNLMQLMSCFRTAQNAELENLLEPMLEIMTRSVRLNQSLGRSSLFVMELLNRLQLVPKAIVRKNLLKMLKSLFDAHANQTQFIIEFNLHPVIYTLAQDANSMILVKEIASQLLQSILNVAAVD